MADQIPLDRSDRAPETMEDGHVHQIAPDLAYKRLTMVNVVFFGLPDAGDRNWVLIDAGIPGSKGAIKKAADARFGTGSRPSAIILTHGHFDHVGSIVDLANEWDAPVYAHPLEKPYLDGTEKYPPPNAAAGGGIMPLISPLLPRDSVDLGARLQMLPSDGTVPFMPGWKWLHTPGHAPGHVSLWHEMQETLIAGDAIVTTGQESAYEVAVQEPEMHGPPRYFTPDWVAAEQSVKQLAQLEAKLVITGHGRAMSGGIMMRALHQLADNFREIAVPKNVR